LTVLKALKDTFLPDFVLNWTLVGFFSVLTAKNLIIPFAMLAMLSLIRSRPYALEILVVFPQPGLERDTLALTSDPRIEPRRQSFQRVVLAPKNRRVRRLWRANRERRPEQGAVRSKNLRGKNHQEQWQVRAGRSFREQFVLPGRRQIGEKV
jgi:hypothetical protein